MSETRLMEGSEVFADAMVRAGCRFFAGYPMTPFTEVLEHMATALPPVGGVCINAESELEAVGVELVEEPVSGLSELATLSRGTSIPLVADESVNDASEAADACMEGACAAVTVKLSKIGSLDAGLGGHLPTYLSSALDGPVGIAAAAHVAQTLDPALPWPDMAHGLATGRLFEEELSTEGPLTVRNRLDPPSNGFGLGVELDERVLSLCRL